MCNFHNRETILNFHFTVRGELPTLIYVLLGTITFPNLSQPLGASFLFKWPISGAHTLPSFTFFCCFLLYLTATVHIQGNHRNPRLVHFKITCRSWWDYKLRFREFKTIIYVLGLEREKAFMKLVFSKGWRYKIQPKEPNKKKNYASYSRYTMKTSSSRSHNQMGWIIASKCVSRSSNYWAIE